MIVRCLNLMNNVRFSAIKWFSDDCQRSAGIRRITQSTEATVFVNDYNLHFIWGNFLSIKAKLWAFTLTLRIFERSRSERSSTVWEGIMQPSLVIRRSDANRTLLSFVQTLINRLAEYIQVYHLTSIDLLIEGERGVWTNRKYLTPPWTFEVFRHSTVANSVETFH